MKSFKLLWNGWFHAIWLSSVSLGIFMIKKCFAFSLIYLGTLKDDCDIKASEMIFCLSWTIQWL